MFAENNETYRLPFCLYSEKTFSNLCIVHYLCVCKFVTIYLKITGLIITQCKRIFFFLSFRFKIEVYLKKKKFDLKKFPFLFSLICDKSIFVSTESQLSNFHFLSFSFYN